MRLERNKLYTWLFEILNTRDYILEELVGDASPRQYLRLKLSKCSFIIMLAPVDDSLRAFIKMSKFFVANNILAPKVYYTDLVNGFLLLQDFGDELLLKTLCHAEDKYIACKKWYIKAIDTLITLQKLPIADNPLNGNFDEHYLLERLDLLKTWYLNKYLKIKFNNQKLDLALEDLTKALLSLNQELPQVLVHLDYHSRNLLVLPHEEIGILDFQDAKRGPATYDLLSLLQDAYIICPEKLVTELLDYYINQAIAAGILPTKIDKDKIYKSFYLFGLHRHLKNLGVFARLAIREQNESYLPHIPTLIKYILDICEKFPEFESLSQFFKER